MAVVWLTVPTAGRDTLTAAIDSTGIPRDRTVIVATAPDAIRPEGCHVVEDFGEINIHRWWNAGLDYAQAHGATHVLVINDDVLLDETTVPALLDGMEGRAAIGSPGAGGIFEGDLPEWRVMNGACWLLDLATGLRADERYRWWYGDNDLDWRARTEHGGVASVRCYFQHVHANELTAASPELMRITDDDNRTWMEGRA